VDLFDPSSGLQVQVHDLSPGTQPNGLFWTAQLPPDAFDISDGGRGARLRLRQQPMVDTFTLGGPLGIAAQVSLDVVWGATSEPIARGKGTAADPTSPAAFSGDFAEASCRGRVSGFETGFAFETSTLTATDFFAEMGQERNGSFLS
jgi:hypothetical protein